jgi:hypothetical protein
VRFIDPIRTVLVELPPGWAYSPFDSTLTDFYFSRWDHPEQLIAVHVRPTSVGQEQPYEKWVEQIRSEVGGTPSLAEIAAKDGPAVAADFGSADGVPQRVAFIRGKLVELVIEQRGVEPGSRNPWLALEMAVGTASSAVNVNAPEKLGEDEVNRSIEAANQAFEKKEFTEVVDALERAIKIGTAAWLCSLVPPVNSPEIHAAARVAQAMMHMGSFTGGPSLPRDAESVLLRVQCTLERMGPMSESARQFKAELDEALRSILSETMEGSEANTGENVSPILGIRERGFRLAHAAAKAFEAQDLQSAYELSGMAVEDILSLISFLRRDHQEEVPSELATHLAGQGITDPADQIQTMKRGREALLYPLLNQSLQIRYCCATELQYPGASDAAEMLVPVAKLIAAADPEDPGTTLNRALARMDFAGILMMSNEDGDLDEAERWLGSAAQIIESMGDKTPDSDRWTRYLERQLEEILRAIDRRLAGLKENKIPISETKLQSLRSRFESLAGQFRNKIPHTTS